MHSILTFLKIKKTLNELLQLNYKNIHQYLSLYFKINSFYAIFIFNIIDYHRPITVRINKHLDQTTSCKQKKIA